MVEKELMLTNQEKKLIEKLREVTFGSVTIFIEDKTPVRIEKIKESIKL